MDEAWDLVKPFNWPDMDLRNVVHPLPGRPRTSSISPLLTVPSKLCSITLGSLLCLLSRIGRRASAIHGLATVGCRARLDAIPETVRDLKETPTLARLIPSSLTSWTNVV